MHRRDPSRLCLANRFVLSRLRFVSLTRRSPSSHRAPPLSRSLLTDLASRPFFLQHERTTCCSRAHLRRACVRPLLPCATRAARVLRTKSRLVSSRFSLVSFSPLQRSTPRALAHPLVTLLSLVAHGRHRPCCAPIARSRSCSPHAFSSSCCACATQSTHPLLSFFGLLYPPNSLTARRRLCDLYSVLHLRFPSSFSSFHVLFFHLSSARSSSIFTSLTSSRVALSRARGDRLFLSIFLSFFLFRLPYPTLSVNPHNVLHPTTALPSRL